LRAVACTGAPFQKFSTPSQPCIYMDDIDREYAAALAAYRAAYERLRLAKRPVALRAAAEAEAKRDKAEERQRQRDLDYYMREARDEALQNAICQAVQDGMDADAAAKHFGISPGKVKHFVRCGPSTYYAESLAELRSRP
jgi:hypothetical protein